MSLSFLREDLDSLAAFLGAATAPTESEWHITHNVFLPTEAARDAVERAVEPLGLFVSYRDEIDDDVRPFWLDLMERVPPSVTDVESCIQRVLDTLAKHDGEYNSFTIIGSRGESFP